MNAIKQKKTIGINFSTVNTPIKKTVDEMIKTLKQRSLQYDHLVAGILLTCHQTYKAACFLVAKDNEFKYSAQAFILVRSLIDSLFSIMLLKENPEKYFRKFNLNGYRFVLEEYEREFETYKDFDKFTDYLNGKKFLVDTQKNDLNLTSEEEKNIHKSFWPTPSQMLKNKLFSGDNQDFLNRIYNWEYKKYSEASHLSWGGIAMGIFSNSPEEHWDPGKFESDAAYKAMLSFVMILTEIEDHYKIGLSKEITFVWQKLSEGFEEAKEYYEIRFMKILDYK